MKELTKAKNLTANTATVLYTVPIGYFAVLTMLYAHNGSTSTKTISATWHNFLENTDIAVLNAVPLISKQYILADNGVRIVMDEKDTLTMLSESGSTYHTIGTFELFKKN